MNELGPNQLEWLINNVPGFRPVPFCRVRKNMPPSSDLIISYKCAVYHNGDIKITKGSDVYEIE